MKYTANISLKNWHTYEYVGEGHKNKPPHIFHKLNFSETGGPQDLNYAWAEDSKWTIDTPESPNSILALLCNTLDSFYPPMDLRGSKISFYMKGENLKLYGARCFFWVVFITYKGTTRWHFTHHPIEISDVWGDRREITLINDESKWHRSFSNSSIPANLDTTLGAVFSFGFSFVGFEQKVKGKLFISDFKIEKEFDTAWPYCLYLNDHRKHWLTVSRKSKRQISIQTPDKDYGLFVSDDYLLFGNEIKYSYLAFVHKDLSTKGKNILDSVIFYHSFQDKFDNKNGTIHFFIENSLSNTICIYALQLNVSDSIFILKNDSRYWHQIGGNIAVEELLKGNESQYGYDYFGFMLLNSTDTPTGVWGLANFNIGPTIQQEI